MNRTLKGFWIAGFFVGALFYFCWHLQNSGYLGYSDPDALLVWQNITMALWPSSLMLMALTREHSVLTWIVVFISMCLNGFIYMGGGYVVLKLFSGSSTDNADSS